MSKENNKKSGLTGERIEACYDRIRELYIADNRPWIIGFSGGKDSTCTLQAIWYALDKLPREQLTKPIHVICSDTLVETPVIISYIDRILERLGEQSKKSNLPLSVHKLAPLVDNTFWVNLIGRGYPAPYSNFRWCTERMKIEPTTRFISEQVAQNGEVMIALGVRSEESSNRAGHIQKREKLHGVSDMVTRHNTLPNAWVFTPIRDWTTSEVWEYLMSVKSPWGGGHRELITLYRNAHSGECPIVIDKTTNSCGNSRFGCWTCTVVQKDTSMEAMIDNGEDWLQPLVEFRDWLAETNNPERKKDLRDFRRRTGRIQYREVDGKKRLIYGPFKLDARKTILRRLLTIQKNLREEGPNPKEILISNDELLRIRQLWRFDEGDWHDSLPGIYQEVMGEMLDFMEEDWSGMGAVEHEVLSEAALECDIPPRLLTELFDAERSVHGMSRRVGIYDKIHAVLNRDWDSYEEALAVEEEGMESVLPEDERMASDATTEG